MQSRLVSNENRPVQQARDFGRKLPASGQILREETLLHAIGKLRRRPRLDNASESVPLKVKTASYQNGIGNRRW